MEGNDINHMCDIVNKHAQKRRNELAAETIFVLGSCDWSFRDFALENKHNFLVTELYKKKKNSAGWLLANTLKINPFQNESTPI